MTKKLTRIKDEKMDLLLNHTTKLTNPLPLAEVIKFAISVRDTQLAHCQKEHDQAVKEERQAIGKWLDKICDHYFPPLHRTNCPKCYELLFEALKQGKLPEGIKEKK